MEVNNMPLPLLIAKDKNAKFLKNDYKLGWILEDDESFYWSVWGSSKDYDTAMSAAKDLLNQKGYRKIFVSNNPIPKECIISKKECSFQEIEL
jgi:hypothetical protein